MTGILADEALDACAKLLCSVRFKLMKFPIWFLWTFDTLDFACHFIIPRDVCDEILDVRKRSKGSDIDRFALWCLSEDIGHAGHAHKLGFAVDLSTT